MSNPADVGKGLSSYTLRRKKTNSPSEVMFDTLAQLADIRPTLPSEAERQKAQGRLPPVQPRPVHSGPVDDVLLEHEERRQTIALRDRYARKAYRFVCKSVYLLFLMVGADLLFRVIFHGYSLVIPSYRELPPAFQGLDAKVLIALVSGVTVNVVAVFVVVMRNLFPHGTIAKEKNSAAKRPRRRRR